MGRPIAFHYAMGRNGLNYLWAVQEVRMKLLLSSWVCLSLAAGILPAGTLSFVVLNGDLTL